VRIFPERSSCILLVLAAALVFASVANLLVAWDAGATTFLKHWAVHSVTIPAVNLQP
jgi:hypothetical protein